VLLAALETPRGEEVEDHDVALEVGESYRLAALEGCQFERWGGLAKQWRVDQTWVGAESGGKHDGERHCGQGYPVADPADPSVHAQFSPDCTASRSAPTTSLTSVSISGSARTVSRRSSACSRSPMPHQRTWSFR